MLSKSAEFDRVRPKFGRAPPDSGRNRSKLGNFGPSLSDIGPNPCMPARASRRGSPLRQNPQSHKKRCLGNGAQDVAMCAGADTPACCCGAGARPPMWQADRPPDRTRTLRAGADVRAIPEADSRWARWTSGWATSRKRARTHAGPPEQWPHTAPSARHHANRWATDTRGRCGGPLARRTQHADRAVWTQHITHAPDPERRTSSGQLLQRQKARDARMTEWSRRPPANNNGAAHHRRSKRPLARRLPRQPHPKPPRSRQETRLRDE